MLPEQIETRILDSTNAESRSRMISFRVTAEEFQRYRQLCLQRGLRNVSEFVRLAVNQLQPEHAPAAHDHTLHNHVATLEARLAALEARLDSAPSHSLAQAAGEQ